MAQDASPMTAAIALGRFGFGAGPGEIARVAAGPRDWLEAQITPAGAPNPPGDFPDTAAQVEAFTAYRANIREDGSIRPGGRDPAAPMDMQDPEGGMRPAQDPAAQAAFDARRAERQGLAQQSAAAFLARAQWAATTPGGFAERWATFWANQLTISATKFQSAVFIDSYEREAVRPHVFGPFEDLLLACESHPGMLLYLDQAQSVGPDSPGGRRRDAGLNENLAREILELHTVGADGGYSQADVTELARALTGWSIDGGPGAAQARRPRLRAGRGRARGEPVEGGRVPGLSEGFLFREIIHQPGSRTVLGRTYPEGGVTQGAAILTDLARRPETGRRLCRRIAAHFCADVPDPALVAALESAWTVSRGDLAAVARALIAAPAAWDPAPVKIKTPYDFVVSTHRAVGVAPPRVQALNLALESMGQPAWRPPSPEGWPDMAEDWAGPDALVKRLNWAKSVADMLETTAADPVVLAERALGPRLGERTRQTVARAESRAEGLTLFLMSPEFQRR